MPEYNYQVTASIVLYNSDKEEIEHVSECFMGSGLKVKLYLIDNSADERLGVLGNGDNIIYINTGKNLGYGAGHNIAIRKSSLESKYHLILNPDVSFDPNVIETTYYFMELHNEVGMISPAIRFPDGRPQFMCRQLPTPFDLFSRRFLPGLLKKLFKKRLDSYTLSDLDFSKRHNIPNLPGSFMFLRQEAVAIAGPFDENFFMYVEDVDLTRRINAHYQTLYFPDVEIIHGLEQSSYKFNKLLIFHIKSAIYYFNKWGWLFDSDRRSINDRIR